jgi:translocation and assembly module TamB
MRRFLEIGAWSVGAVLLLVVMIGATIVVAGNTSRGRVLIERLTARLTAGEVTVSDLGGSFPADLEIGRLQLRDARGVWLTAERVTLHWSPLALLAWRVKIESLRVSRLDLERLPATHPSRGNRRTLPHIDIGAATLDVLELGQQLLGVQSRLFAQASVHWMTMDDISLSLLAHCTDGSGRYELHLSIDHAGIDASVALEEPTNGPIKNLLDVPDLGALSVEASVKGPRDVARIQLQARAGELRAQTRGTVDLIAGSADLDYGMQSPAMEPRPDLSWKRIDLAGQWRGTLTEPHADGRLQIDQLGLPGGFRLGTLSADLRSERGMLTVDSMADGIVLPGRNPRLLQDSPLRLSAAVHLDSPSRPMQIAADHRLFSVQAQVVTGGEQSVTFEAKLPDLEPLAALTGQALPGSAVLKGKLTRRSAATHLSVDGSVALTGTAVWARILEKAARVHLSASLTDRALEVEQLTLNGPAAFLTASGSASREASSGFIMSMQALRARWDLTLSDLAALSPTLGGTLKMNGRLVGPLTSFATQMRATSNLSIRGTPLGTIMTDLEAHGLPRAPSGTLQVRGILDAQPLRLEMALERGRGNTLHATIGRTDWKSAHVEGELTIGPTPNQTEGSLRLHMDQLSDLQRLLGSDLRGSVAGSLRVTPAQNSPAVRLELEGRDIVAANFSGGAKLTALGPLEAMKLGLAVQAQNIAGSPAHLNSVGLLRWKAREVDIGRVAATYRDQSLRLLSPAKLMFGDGLSIEKLSVGAQKAVFQIDGRILPGLDVRASAHQIDSALVNTLVPGLLSRGSVEADARLTGTLGRPFGRLTVTANSLRFANEYSAGLPQFDVIASAQFRGDAAQIDARLSAGKDLQLTLVGRAPLSGDGSSDLSVGGRLDAALLNGLLETEGRHVAGLLTIDVKIKGAAKAPEIEGTVDLAKGEVRNYTQGVHLSDISGRMEGRHGTLQLTSMTARAASGHVSVSGTIGLMQPNCPVNLHLTAQNATPISSDVVTANLDADLRVQGTVRQRMVLAGMIHLNRVDIIIPSSYPPNVAVLDVRSPGQVAPKPKKQRLAIALDISMSAPRQIRVHGRGLDAELSGEMHIGGTTAAPRVSGGLDLIRGTFSLASARLVFSKGRVSFSGASPEHAIDPSLDFIAQTTVADSTSTLHILGFADAPQFEISSTPQLPQDEILARLLFGESASQLSALQGAQIGAAIATLSGIRGDRPTLLTKVKNGLALDTLSISAVQAGAGDTQGSGATIEAGRYVTDRLFVVGKSTKGAFQVGVDVDMSKHLKLESRFGNGTATAQGTTPDNDPGSSVGATYQFEY